jgi:hypothetical protein
LIGRQLFFLSVFLSALHGQLPIELLNDNVLLVTGCFQYRPTGAPDPLLPLAEDESRHSERLN